jgi:hypothetical protein
VPFHAILMLCNAMPCPVQPAMPCYVLLHVFAVRPSGCCVPLHVMYVLYVCASSPLIVLCAPSVHLSLHAMCLRVRAPRPPPPPHTHVYFLCQHSGCCADGAAGLLPRPCIQWSPLSLTRGTHPATAGGRARQVCVLTREVQPGDAKGSAASSGGWVVGG